MVVTGQHNIIDSILKGVTKLTLQEFEALTGFYPSSELFKAIETAYNAFDGDRATFCKIYRENTYGLAEDIRRRADEAHRNSRTTSEREMTLLKQQVQDLQQKLDLELDWVPYESEHNVSQADYQNLADCASGTAAFAHFMSDAEAKDWIYSEFGFAKEMVTIIREVDIEEINRHQQIRKTGKKLARPPVYHAIDYHYIRFNTPRWCYEVWNGRLRPFFS